MTKTNFLVARDTKAGDVPKLREITTQLILIEPMGQMADMNNPTLLGLYVTNNVLATHKNNSKTKGAPSHVWLSLVFVQRSHHLSR
jgi:hypothetical protein